MDGWMDECTEYFNEWMSAFPIGPLSPEGRGYTVACPRVMPNNAHDK